MKKEFRAWLVILALNLIVVIACAWDSAHREPVVEEVVEESETEIIQWKDTEISVEENEIVEVTEPTEKEDYYSVPLSEELQLHIFKECEKHNIEPALILAMIERESQFTASSMGDKGESYGLMQLKLKYQKERMERLGCTDLLDPFQNVTVGIDYVAWLIDQNDDVYWVLMAYNGWIPYANARIESGNISEYALGIVERASELAKEAENAIN